MIGTRINDYGLGLAESSENGFGDFINSIGRLVRVCLSQVTDNLPLALTRNFTIAYKSGQHLFMAEILTPCFKLFRGMADLFAELNKGISEAVWIKVRQTCGNEGIPKNGADRRGGAPVLPC